MAKISKVPLWGINISIIENIFGEVFVEVNSRTEDPMRRIKRVYHDLFQKKQLLQL